MDEKEYLDTEEAQAYLGMARSTLFKYIKERNLQSYRRPGTRKSFYKKSDLDTLKQFEPREESDNPKKALITPA